MKSQNQFTLLAEFTPRGIFLNHDGLKIIEYYDHLSIVTIQGELENRSMKSSLIDSRSRSEIRNSDKGVWIGRYPKYSHHLTRYIIILRIIGDDEQTLLTAHTFCALISNVIILVWNDNMDIKYLCSIGEKMKNLPGDQQIKKIGALCTFPKRNPGDCPTFKQMLERKNMGMRNFEHFYPQVYLYDDITKSETERALNSGGQIINTIFQICPAMQDEVFKKGYHGNQQLVYGPVVASYIQNLIQCYNKTQRFDVVLAQEAIEIEQEYEQYLLGLQKYNTKCKSKLSNQPTQDVRAILFQIRQGTQNQQLYTNYPYYAQKMSIYMDRKEEQLCKLNEQLLDVQNLSLLENLSNQALRKIKRDKTVTATQINQEIDILSNKYKIQAANTPNRDRLLADFIQVFTPTAYDETNLNYNLNRQIQHYDKDNSKLKEQIQDLKNKKKKKEKGNQCCVIM